MISVFLSCPVRPVGDETKDGNLELALQYYKELSIALPDYAFIMPWWVNCKVFPETEEQVAIGMARNRHWIERCAETWVVGLRVSGGMQDEADYTLGFKDKIVRRVRRHQQHDGLLVAVNVRDPNDGVDIRLSIASALWRNSHG